MRKNKSIYRVYISMPIAGYDIEERKAYAKKIAAEETERYLNLVKVVTPFDVCKENSLSYEECLGKDLAALLQCDIIIMCEGWRKSIGCRVEHSFAKEVNICIVYREDEDSGREQENGLQEDHRVSA